MKNQYLFLLLYIFLNLPVFSQESLDFYNCSYIDNELHDWQDKERLGDKNIDIKFIYNCHDFKVKIQKIPIPVNGKIQMIKGEIVTLKISMLDKNRTPKIQFNQEFDLSDCKPGLCTFEFNHPVPKNIDSFNVQYLGIAKKKRNFFTWLFK